ncbi:MAG: CO dehydrogenase/acetyl-CoA synthase complex subunit alpha [Halobacteriota archaeon]|nr:CO dehydrogenase/acetyl-CoA synthase complex subunit alpha [Halobacteriota archaeon]
MDKLNLGGISLKDLENVRINIGEVIDEEDEWEEMGPHPKPKMTDLRHWDFKLLDRYKPFYAPQCDVCALCTYGKCDLTGNKRGACGISMEAMQGRIVLLACLIGCSAHTAHGRHMLHDVVRKFGRDVPIDLGPDIAVEAPLTRLICGIKPKTISDFEPVLDYIEEQIVQLTDALHTGQEGSAADFESKALQMGMLDSLGKEVADMIQIACYGMPCGEGDVPLVDVGMGTINQEKPFILVIGHNAPPSIDITDYLTEHGLEDDVEIGGICCTSIDITRRYQKAKIVSALGRQLRVVRTGFSDLIIIDEQCIRADIVEQAKAVGTPVIATNDKAMHGLVDRTDDPADEIIDDLVKGRVDGVAILDPFKLGEIAVKVAMKMHPIRANKDYILSDDDFMMHLDNCIQCGNCTLACPQGLKIGGANKKALEGDTSALAKMFDICVGCGRCEQVCKKGIPIVDVMVKAARPLIANEKGRMRIGRGPIRDTEIRNVGAPIVLGTIPGIIAPIGCGNYPNGTEDVYLIAKEFAERGYIVTMTGCMAIDAALWHDEDGKTLYETHHANFDRGGVLNVGSCVSNAHIHGAAIKVASIFARRNIRANYDEIADYILNRVGACGVAWGAMSQKAASIATGFNRLGIPAVVGPHGVKYRRAFLGRKDIPENWEFIDCRDGSTIRCEPCPEHLLVAAETVEECLPLMAKLCLRVADTPQGRQIKLTHYIDLSKKYLKIMPPDWSMFVRSEADLPLADKELYLKILEEEHDWKIDWDKMKILKGPIRPPDPSFDPTNLARLIREARVK